MKFVYFLTLFFAINVANADLTPNSNVISVNGYTGTVNLNATDVGLGNYASTYLRLNRSSNYVEIDSPASMSGNYTLHLPGAQGTNGQTLLNDGAGNLSWGSGGGGGAVTSVNGLTGAVNVVGAVYAARASSGTDTTLSGLQTIDGVPLDAGDRILLRGQSTQSQNGLWTVASGAWSRPSDANASFNYYQGLSVYVLSGTINEHTIWNLTTEGPITLGTTSLAFSRYLPKLATVSALETNAFGQLKVSIDDLTSGISNGTDNNTIKVLSSPKVSGFPGKNTPYSAGVLFQGGRTYLGRWGVDSLGENTQRIYKADSSDPLKSNVVGAFYGLSSDVAIDSQLYFSRVGPTPMLAGDPAFVAADLGKIIYLIPPSGSGNINPNWSLTPPGSGSIVPVGVLGYSSILASTVLDLTPMLPQASGGSGANVTLSNLTSPTAVSQDLTFNTGVTEGDFARINTPNVTGSGSIGLEISTGTSNDPDYYTGEIDIFTGNGATNSGSGSLNFRTGNASGVGYSGDIAFSTGGAVDGGGGNIFIATQNPSGSATRGHLFYIDGTQGTAGHVLTSADTNGQARWAAPAVVAAHQATHESGGSAPLNLSKVWGKNTVLVDAANYSTVQSAINYAETLADADDGTKGVSVLIPAGKFAENLVIKKNIFLVGQGRGATNVLTVTSRPSSNVVGAARQGLVNLSVGYDIDITHGVTLTNETAASSGIYNTTTYLGGTANGNDGFIVQGCWLNFVTATNVGQIWITDSEIYGAPSTWTNVYFSELIHSFVGSLSIQADDTSPGWSSPAGVNFYCDMSEIYSSFTMGKPAGATDPSSLISNCLMGTVTVTSGTYNTLGAAYSPATPGNWVTAPVDTNGALDQLATGVYSAGVTLATTASIPTCDSSKRGLMWVIQGGVGVKDLLEICTKLATNAYSWSIVTTTP